MADSSSPPSGSIQVDPSQVELLFAGNIADDDLMWIIRCSVKEFRRMVQAPSKWVASLGGLPDWRYFDSDEPAPAPILTDDFVMAVREPKRSDPDGWVTVQGISLTNAITILTPYSPADSAVRTALGPYDAFWDAVAADPASPPTYKKPFAVNVVVANSTWYGHFELMSPGQTQAERAARTATFLLATVEDAAGYAAMLNSLVQTTLFIDGATVTPGSSIVVNPSAVGNVSPVYSSIGDDVDVLCNLLDGPYDQPTDHGSGKGELGGILVKRYGVEDGPQAHSAPI